jgi:hypothetical protein
MLSGKWCAILLSKHRNHLNIWTIRGLFLLTVTSLLAYSALAQPTTTPLSCSAAVGPSEVRAEGLTEQVSDVVLNCTGGVPTPKGKAIPEHKITLSLDTDVTSRRLLKGSDLSEALLIVDDAFPANPVPSGTTHGPGAPPQILCTPLGSICAEKGTGAGSSPYQTQPNVFVGKQDSVNSFQWTVPLDPPGTSGTRTLRLTNLSVDPFMLGVSSTLIPAQILAVVEIQGSQPVILEIPELVLATVLPGTVTSAVPSKPIQQCEPHNAVLLGGSGKAAFDFSIQVEESFSNAFQIRNYGTVLGAIYPVVEQNVPGYAYFTETGFYSPSLFTSAPTLGLADFGTRIHISLGPVSAGTHLFLPTHIAMLDSLGNPTGGALRLIHADENGDSAPGYKPITFAARIDGEGVAEASLSGSTAYATYEVVAAYPNKVETVTIPFAVAFTDVPATGMVIANTSLAPLSKTGATDQSSSIPRFANIFVAQEVYSIVSCPAP